MGKFKLKKIKIGSYLRELSIVIIGVAVTLTAGGIIGNIQEKNDLKLQMDAIYTELEDNKERVESLKEFYEERRKLQFLLIKDHRNPGSVDQDSIKKYNNVVGRVKSFVYKNNAYSMLINTGAIKSFKNKKLLLDITESYTLLQSIKESHMEQMGLLAQLFNNVYSMDSNWVIDQHDIKKFPGLYNFYMMSSGDLEMIVETIDLIDKITSQNGKRK